jgi:hypothetical protein
MLYTVAREEYHGPALDTRMDERRRRWPVGRDQALLTAVLDAVDPLQPRTADNAQNSHAWSLATGEMLGERRTHARYGRLDGLATE